MFDKVDEQWLAVASGSVSSRPAVAGFDGCKFPNEYWEVIVLEPRPDGTLSGDYKADSSSGCYTHRTVTFTRTGEVDSNSLPDPSSQSPRVRSPAEGFDGHYHVTNTYTINPLAPVEVNELIRTHCLRTGERCISYVDQTSDRLFFANEQWTLDAEGDIRCSGGNYAGHVKRHIVYELSQPSQKPIMLLSGKGRDEYTGETVCKSDDFDSQYKRTGD